MISKLYPSFLNTCSTAAMNLMSICKVAQMTKVISEPHQHYFQPAKLNIGQICNDNKNTFTSYAKRSSAEHLPALQPKSTELLDIRELSAITHQHARKVYAGPR